MKTVAIIPAFNEERTIAQVIRSVLSEVDEIIVVDDGSMDGTVPQAQQERVVVVSHPVNCGLGAALATGMAVAADRGADVAVTFDADGQLYPEDIRVMLKPLEQGMVDVVIGSRFLTTTSSVPVLRRCYNSIGNLLTGILFGIWTSDSQSGIRGFNHAALEAIHLRCSRMEVSSQFFREISKHQLRWSEVPIRVRYTAYSLSKGQSFTRGISTAFRLALRRYF